MEEILELKNEEQVITDIIKAVNNKSKKRFKITYGENRSAVKSLLKKARNKIGVVYEYIDNNAENYESILKLCDDFVAENILPIKTEKDKNLENALAFLSEAVVTSISKIKEDEIKDRISLDIKTSVEDFLRKEYGIYERKIITKIDDLKPVELKETTHEKFEQVLKFVSNNEPVFLTGRAGTGKNVICKQVAKSLGLDFYFSNAVTQEYKITGFTDATGVYHETQFYKAFKNGGLFMLDEIDASIPEVLVILNAAIANGYFDFPAPIGYVEAHKDFRVVAAGNTFGLGADYEYVGRNQLDMASLDRFALVKIDYDYNIELNCAMGDDELVKFAEDFRNSAEKNGVRTLISYRCIKRLAKMLKVMSIEEALETCLVKSLEKDDLRIITNGLKESKYKSALRSIEGKL